MTTILNKRQQESILKFMTECRTYQQTINGIQRGNVRNVMTDDLDIYSPERHIIKFNIKTNHDDSVNLEEIRNILKQRGIV